MIFKVIKRDFVKVLKLSRDGKTLTYNDWYHWKMSAEIKFQGKRNGPSLDMGVRIKVLVKFSMQVLGQYTHVGKQGSQNIQLFTQQFDPLL